MKANRMIKIRLQILIVFFILKDMWLSENTSRIHNIINENTDFFNVFLKMYCVCVCLIPWDFVIGTLSWIIRLGPN